MSDELKKQIEEVVSNLPIENPAQLYLRKDSVYVDKRSIKNMLRLK